MKWKLIAVLAVCVGALVGVSSSGAKRAAPKPLTYVGTAANCNNLTPRKNTIQLGVDYVDDGGTVNVCKGTFAENVIVDHPVKIKGVTRPALVTNCSTTVATATKDSILDGGGGQSALDIESSDVSVSGLVITNAQWGVVIDLANQAGSYGGLSFTKNSFEMNEDGLFPDFNSSGANLIQSNCFRNNTQDGIGSGWTDGTNQNLTISGNKFTKNPYASIVLASGTSAGANDDFHITGNIVNADGMFVGLINASNFDVSNNIVKNADTTGTGELAVVHLGGNNTDGTIKGNIFTNGTDRGFAFNQNYVPTTNANLLVQGNVLNGFKDTGIDVESGGLTDSTFQGNIVKTTGANALLLDGGNPNNSFQGNILTGKTFGCKVLAGKNQQNWNGNSNIGKPKNTGGTCWP